MRYVFVLCFLLLGCDKDPCLDAIVDCSECLRTYSYQYCTQRYDLPNKITFLFSDIPDCFQVVNEGGQIIRDGNRPVMMANTCEDTFIARSVDSGQSYTIPPGGRAMLESIPGKDYDYDVARGSSTYRVRFRITRRQSNSICRSEEEMQDLCGEL